MYWKLLVLSMMLCIVGIHRVSAAEPQARTTDELIEALSGPNATVVREERLSQWFRDAKFGLFLHWGPASISGAEISWGRMDRIEGGEKHQKVPGDVYDKLYREFDPVKFDADEWVLLAKEAGMKYIVFITKHHDGFSMWHTEQTHFTEPGKPSRYSIADTPYKRDLCREIIDAAHRHGLKFGWYYSTRDWTHPEYLKGDNSIYNDYYEAQVRELLTNYGKVDIMWFDHTAGNWRDYTLKRLYRMMYDLQPDLLVNNRAARFFQRTDDLPSRELASLVMGDYDTPEQRIGTFQNDRAWESCMTMSKLEDGGGWSYRPDGRILSLKECLQTLVSTVVGDGNLLLNIGPMPTGSFQPQEIANLKGMGAWLRSYGESIYGTRGGPWMNGSWGGTTHKGNTVYVHVLEWGGDTLECPPLAGKVRSAEILTGGRATIDQSDSGISITLPEADRDDVVTIIKLTLDRPVTFVTE
jgi:alpha-L-fucosidase